MNKKEQYAKAYSLVRTYSSSTAQNFEIEEAREELAQMPDMWQIAQTHYDNAFKKYQSRLQFVLQNPPFVITPAELALNDALCSIISVRQLRNPLEF